MIRIEFPAARTDIALAMSKALADIAGVAPVTKDVVKDVAPVDSKDVPIKEYVDPYDNCPYHAAVTTSITAWDSTTSIDEDAMALCVSTLKSVYAEHEADIVSLETVPDVMAGLECDPMEVFEDEDELTKALYQKFPDSGTPSVDSKGVAKDAAYCANAADPFYASGKRRGQWKKKKGVTEEEYDAWHNAQAGTQIDTKAAFTPQTQETTPTGPTNVSELMVWVSERQAAGHITAEQVTQAYANNNITNVATLFTMAPEAQAVVVANITMALKGE